MELLGKARPPFVRFFDEVRESRDAEGRPVYRDVVMAEIIPAGGKDALVKVADDWVAELKNKGQSRAQFDPDAQMYGEWHKLVKEALKDYREGREAPLNGTSLKAFPAFTPSEIRAAENAHIFTIEDMSAANEVALQTIGMGGRAMKDKAAALMENKSTSDLASQISALKVENEELRRLLEEAIERIPKDDQERRGPGRPRKEAA
jgi:hypothetical protein